MTFGHDRPEQVDAKAIARYRSVAGHTAAMAEPCQPL